MKTLITLFIAALLTIPATVFAAGGQGSGHGDYLPAHNFKIEIDGVIAGGFKEISGIETEVEIIEYKDGDDPVTHKRAGKAKYKNIVLRRAYTGEFTYFGDWFKKVLAGTTDRKSGSIIYLDRTGNEVLRFSFTGGWPARRSIIQAKEPLSGETHIVEEIEFVVEKVERA